MSSSHLTSYQFFGPARVLTCYELEPVSYSGDPDEKEAQLPNVTGAYVNHEFVPRAVWENYLENRVCILETWEEAIAIERECEAKYQADDARIAAQEEERV